LAREFDAEAIAEQTKTANGRHAKL
jgi:hypothetical protein